MAETQRQPIASIEDCEGRKVRIAVEGRVVLVIVPETPHSPEIECSFGPEIALKTAAALGLAAQKAADG